MVLDFNRKFANFGEKPKVCEQVFLKLPEW